MRHVTFGTRRQVVGICLLVCALTMLASILLGQDANWDLRNYHLYSGWAALHGRLSIDLAPAQYQSYFVPWLDVGYYLLAVQGSAMLAGAVLGALHGLAFATAAAVVWLALEEDPRRVWLAPLLALAGCLHAAVFISELGNTMGDNTTAPLVIGALALALLAARANNTRSPLCWLLAGLLLGLALAFKLTNAPYALGLGAAALVAGGGWKRQWRGAALMTLAALVVFVLIAGPWFWRVYQQFGNPLFPQLNQWFHSPLAWSMANNDTMWLPRHAWQILAWPLLIAVAPNYEGEIRFYQLTWFVLYLLAALFVVSAGLRRIWRKWGRLPSPKPARPSPASHAQSRMLAAFIAVSFVTWMAAFSIHRYLNVLEFLVPLALWLLVQRALPLSAAMAEKCAALLIAACVIAGVAAAAITLKRHIWNHEDWKQPGFAVQAPPMSQPQTATVLNVGFEPQAWRIPFLPAQAAYIGISTAFPAAPGYDLRVHQIAAERGGTVYAVFPGALGNDTPCHCELPHPAEKQEDQNRVLLEEYEHRLHTHGWQLERKSCTLHPSYIGQGNYPFHWCEMTPQPLPPAPAACAHWQQCLR